MKNLSIRLKITLWFSAALAIMVAITYVVVLFVSDQVIQKTIRDSLIETVEHNVDEIEYYDSLEDVDRTSDVDHFVVYGDGYLEVDDDFLDQVNEVYTGLYSEDGLLMYGENPIAREASELSFIDSRIQSLTINGVRYYVFDRKLTADGLDGLWLRGIVSELQGSVQLHSISRMSLFAMPSLMILAILGGYLLAGRMLRPIQQISETASEIGRSGDLKQRIDLGEGKDELHRLADSFNEMFEQLDESFEAQRQFTSDVSHELRTPMTVIMSQCEYSLEEPRSGEEYRKALQVIRRQGARMSKLIRDMLDFTRLETKSDLYPLGEMDLSELVNSICGDMALLREKEIELTYTVQEQVSCIGNCELLARLLSNLVSNAYRYGRENGHIRVELTANESEIRLTVADDGVGISKEEQEKIFRRFYQADNSRAGVGNGLGLAMVREIARFHGGDVQVESEPEQGSIFTVTLPAK